MKVYAKNTFAFIIFIPEFISIKKPFSLVGEKGFLMLL